MFRHGSVAAPVTTRREDSPAQDGAQAPVPKPRPVKSPSTELGPIIKSKIQPPVLRPTTLTRQRLIDQMREATSHRLTLLIAEAGYGKTTLLADFARVSGIRTMWYRLDSSDFDVVDWTNYVVAAIREHDASFAPATASLLREIRTGGPPKDAFISSLISELSTLDARPTVLVLDDFHLVDGIDGPKAFVKRLIDDGPPWLSIVVSSRRRPDLETGRLAAAAQLFEIGTEALRFTHDEMAELFSNVLCIALDDDVLDILEAKTRGWVASLHLFHRSVTERSPAEVRSLARALSGAASPLYDFLAEEVLANIDEDVVELLVRTSLLDEVTGTEAQALFLDLDSPPSAEAIRTWIEQAERFGLLVRSSSTSEATQPHPLLRDFLLRLLEQRENEDGIRRMHRRVADAVVDSDPLTAARHFVAAGDAAEASRALGSSVLLTVGSGRWSTAMSLVEKLDDLHADPAVAAIRARQLVEVGALGDAAKLLDGFEITSSPPEVRAAFRQAELSLGWRTGDRSRMHRVLAEIVEDDETPDVLYDIACVYLDASPLADEPGRLPDIGRRLGQMAGTMANQGMTYYSAIALHDSAVSYLNAGEYEEALDAGTRALEKFARLSYFAAEQLSTHTVMAICEQELGRALNSDAHSRAALASGKEFADVPAELAYLATLKGNSERATSLMSRARVQQRRSQSDAVGDALIDCATALADLRTNPDGAITRLRNTIFDGPLELGYELAKTALLAQALLLAGKKVEALEVVNDSAPQAASRLARRAEAKLAIIGAVASESKRDLDAALVHAEHTGELAILETADVLLTHADWLVPIPDSVERSLRNYPSRWLPSIRRQLEAGNTPNARAAANLLDRHGTVDDVGLLRAYAKTYAKRGTGRHLGQLLARRTSPKLLIHDLGRVGLSVADREVSATSMRRKASSVLMYLVTRPSFVANREQIIDELWPEADPSSGTNNLNQSLFFLRRDIDPWFEDDLSLDYVRFQGELVWLETEFVVSDSVEFVKEANTSVGDAADSEALMLRYAGQFAPEFEYEEWSIAWRSRVHSTFLELANSAIDKYFDRQDFAAAARVAGRALHADPEASDIERRLVWLYGRLGLESAARTQHRHLVRADELDGLETAPLATLLAGPLPDGK